MTRYWPTADPIDRRIIEALPDFDGWRTEPRPPPKYELWPDEPLTSERRGKMLAQHPTIGPIRNVVHAALTDPNGYAPPESVPSPPAPPAPPLHDADGVPRCPCGERIDDGRHLISEAMWRRGLAPGS